MPVLAAAAADEQPRQLHREPRQRVPLARASRRKRWASRSIRDLPPPRCCTTSDGAVRGVATGDMGVARDGTHKADYQPGMELHAKYTLFAEGCRGSLSQELMQRFNLRDGVDPQKYGIGLKELWQVAPEKHQKGLVHPQPGLAARHRTPAAARSSITSTTTWSPSASSSTSTTRTRICRRTTSSSASRRIRRSARRSKAASGSPTARARSTKAACNRCRSSSFPAAR